MALPLRFRLIGRGFHPVLETAADLKAVAELDDAYWVATAAPIASLRGDQGFYGLLDGDGDGRIRSDDLRKAITWLFASLTDTRGISERSDALPLARIAEDGPDGAAIQDAAAKVAGDDATVTLAEARAVLAAEVAKGLSASGRILPAAAGEDEALKGFLEHVIAITGGVEHPSADKAVDQGAVDAFLKDGTAWVAWCEAGAVDEGQTTEIMPLGPATGAAHAAVEALAAKLDQYWLLCDAVALDPALADKARVDPAGTDLLDPTQATELLQRAPLAAPRPDGVLDRKGPLNPAWRTAVGTLFDKAVAAILGEEHTTLDRAGWEQIRARLAAHRAWLAAKPVDAAGDRGLDLLRTHVTDPTLVERTQVLLAASVEGALAVDALKALEKLILYQAHLLPLANNLVAMPALMSATDSGLAEQGRLVIDGREFDLSIKVTDSARAEKFGSMSPIFTMFVMIGEKGGTWTDQIAVPVTAGERGHLVEGQWGVFFPIEGGERHAQIRKIAGSPISIREALMAPFRRIEAAIQAAADKAANAQTSAMDKQVSAAATNATDTATSSASTTIAAGEQAKAAASAPPAPATPPAAPADSSPSLTSQLPVLIAGGGIALAALASAGAYVAEVVWNGAGSLATSFLAMPLVATLPEQTQSVFQVLALPVALLLIGLGLLLVPFLIYAVPVSIATWLRLRKRDLASLLEGAGWAMNTRLMLDRDHAVRLTRKPPVAASDIAR